MLQDQFTWLEEGVLDPAAEGPWIAAAEPGPTRERNLARRVLPATGQ